ncbi:hypothetical protein JOF28_000580 [Leucobacter exalbidus]|uniref:Cytochrome c oxidase polypeptide 4 n=1 Tax=Leucobacter exalbidus TaxID=662960 RepID=A0A940PRC1_9MICO|nr:cytochrome c oxidase subunit 4 [Leucobacter exalbidus]MBP1325348.1 hypothetical protein [Leucobacter exalbidus]
MKANAVIFTILTAYFVVVAATYVIWNFITHGYVEWAGTTALVLGGGLTGFIAFYLMLVIKKQGGGDTPQDQLEADINDADPELGEFSPWSWWPVFLAFGCSIVMLGLAVGFQFWLSFLTIPLVAIGVVGWVYEYYRGVFAR